MLDRVPFEDPPYRLSGTVYGTLLNDADALAALGDAVGQPPYKAAPVAPVLYVNPRNTLALNGASVEVPAPAGELEIGASLGVVIGRTACRLDEHSAMDHVAGYTLVADLCEPHASFYRPSVRLRALDGSCLVGPKVVARSAVADPDRLEIRVSVDGRVVQVANTSRMKRSVARLLVDVTDFMTLRPGDILLLATFAGAPRARAGSSFGIEADGLGCLRGHLVAATAGVAP